MLLPSVQEARLKNGRVVKLQLLGGLLQCPFAFRVQEPAVGVGPPGGQETTVRDTSFLGQLDQAEGDLAVDVAEGFLKKVEYLVNSACGLIRRVA